MVKKKMKKKKQMNIFMSNQTWADGTYHLAYGQEGTTDMNKRTHTTRHRLRAAAVKRKNMLVRKFKKQGYKVDYIYAAD